MRRTYSGAKVYRLWVSGLFLSVSSCGLRPPMEHRTRRTDPAAEFEALEHRLLSAGTVRLRFHVTAEGTVEANLRGALEVGPGEQVRLTASGQFGGRPLDLLLRANGQVCVVDNGERRSAGPGPKYLKEAVLIGLTRMGVLHNLALLASARLPDHAEGGVREWVKARAFAEPGVGADVLSFDVIVSGERTARACLEMDSRRRPRARRQVVEFPTGTMRVVERYSAVTIEALGGSASDRVHSNARGQRAVPAGRR